MRTSLRRIDPTTAAIAALTALAFAVASYRLGAKSMWLDEAVSADHARLGLHGLWQVVSGGDPNMGLYYVLLHFWVRIFGYSEAAVRSMTVVIAGWAVPVMVGLGRRLFDRTTGLVAGLLLALSPFFVQYEQTARSYAILVLLILLSCYCFVRLLQQEGSGGQRERHAKAWLIAYVLASALAIYAHYFAAFVLLIQACTLLAVRRRQALRVQWLVAAGAIVLLCVPEAIFALRKGNGGISWIEDPSLHDLLHLPIQLAGGHLLAAVLLLLACWGFLRSLAQREGWQVGFLAAWLIVPVALDFIVSKLGHPLFVSYYLIVVLPPLLLLAAAGVAKLPLRLTPIVALAALVVLLGLGVRDWYDEPSFEGYRGATRYILERERPGDGVVYSPAKTVYGLAYYQALAGVEGPTKVKIQPAGGPSAGRSRLWLVLRNDSDSPQLEGRIERGIVSGGYEQVGEPARFPDLTVVLYRR